MKTGYHCLGGAGGDGGAANIPPEKESVPGQGGIGGAGGGGGGGGGYPHSTVPSADWVGAGGSGGSGGPEEVRGWRRLRYPVLFPTQRGQLGRCCVRDKNNKLVVYGTEIRQINWCVMVRTVRILHKQIQRRRNRHAA